MHSAWVHAIRLPANRNKNCCLVDELTILLTREMSSSSSFFLWMKWASIRDCSSDRSFSWRFLWMSCHHQTNLKNRFTVQLFWSKRWFGTVNSHQNPLFHHQGSLEQWYLAWTCGRETVTTVESAAFHWLDRNRSSTYFCLGLDSSGARKIKQ